MLAVVLLAATAFGVWRRRVDGRVARPVADATTLTRAELGHELGSRATLVQFSSAFCAPCRAARQVLAHAATTVEGVRHIEVDAESHLDLVRRLGITRTPTTLVLDASGRVVRRASGVPRTPEVLAAVNAVVTS